MKSGLKIIVFLAMLFPYTASAKQIKNYESELIVIYGDILATRNLTKEPNPDFICLLYTSPSPRDKRQSRMPSSA